MVIEVVAMRKIGLEECIGNLPLAPTLRREQDQAVGVERVRRARDTVKPELEPLGGPDGGDVGKHALRAVQATELASGKVGPWNARLGHVGLKLKGPPTPLDP